MNQRPKDKGPHESVNDSGYPFQNAVVAAVEAELQDAGWRVESTEYQWGLPPRYVDAILSLNHVKLVVECKRHVGNWIFLRDVSRPKTVIHSFLASDRIAGHEGASVRYLRCQLAKGIETMAFCKGKGHEQIEPWCAELVEACEDIASAAGLLHNRALLIPVIVTTAQLLVVEQPAGDLGTGRIADESVLTPVSQVVFSKAMPSRTRISRIREPWDLGMLNDDAVRSVLIVNSAAFVDALRNFNFECDPGSL